MTQSTSSTLAEAEFSLIDSNFSGHVAAGSHLSVLVSDNQLQLGVLDLHHRTNVALEAFRFAECANEVDLVDQLAKLFAASKLANYEYKNVSISVCRIPYTLLPSPLFREDAARELLAFNHPLQMQQMVLSDCLEELNVHNVYAIPELVHHKLSQQFPTARIWSSNSTLLMAQTLSSKTSNEERIWVNFHSGQIDLTVIAGSKLRFHNSFKVQAAEDVAYYLLYTLEQLEIATDSVPVVLTGEVRMDSPEYALLERYIKDLQFESPTGGTQFSSALSSMPKHYFYNLLNQYLCA